MNLVGVLLSFVIQCTDMQRINVVTVLTLSVPCALFIILSALTNLLHFLYLITLHQHSKMFRRFTLSIFSQHRLSSTNTFLLTFVAYLVFVTLRFLLLAQFILLFLFLIFVKQIIIIINCKCVCTLRQW